ncbi:MAG: hypothetical protein J5I93_07945 [Pirellulaceae bacterium]|nr:hypothetical protein [Pirellulaceae bacterium]
MRTIGTMIVCALLLGGASLPAQPRQGGRVAAAPGESWSQTLPDRSARGTLHASFQKVRGDSGKWNDDPVLLHAPPIQRKPANVSLDDWADQVQLGRHLPPTSQDDNWLLFKSRQLDDNDRLWIERIERSGNEFTVVLSEAIWQGRYQKTFTWYGVFGVNLGKLPPGDYRATWVVKPLAFRQFEGSGRPMEDQRSENWPKDEQPVDRGPNRLSATFTVAAAAP